MSKIIGSIIIFFGVIDYFTGFIQCSPIGYTLFGLIPPLDLALAGCSMLTVIILIITGLGLFFWKTDESFFKSNKKKK
tara:strand:- start:533 stop:766 length:234 start_codon:yes stop_codon:yes gene_type:complete